GGLAPDREPGQHSFPEPPRSTEREGMEHWFLLQLPAVLEHRHPDHLQCDRALCAHRAEGRKSQGAESLAGSYRDPGRNLPLPAGCGVWRSIWPLRPDDELGYLRFHVLPAHRFPRLPRDTGYLHSGGDVAALNEGSLQARRSLRFCSSFLVLALR